MLGVCVLRDSHLLDLFMGNLKGTEGEESYRKPTSMKPIQAPGMCVHVGERGSLPAQQD